MDGVRERQIRSAKAILSVILRTYSSSLNEEALNSLFVEVVAVVNSLSLVMVEIMNNVDSGIIT